MSRVLAKVWFGGSAAGPGKPRTIAIGRLIWQAQTMKTVKAVARLTYFSCWVDDLAALRLTLHHMCWSWMRSLVIWLSLAPAPRGACALQAQWVCTLCNPKCDPIDFLGHAARTRPSSSLIHKDYTNMSLPQPLLSCARWAASDYNPCT